MAFAKVLGHRKNYSEIQYEYQVCFYKDLKQCSGYLFATFQNLNRSDNITDWALPKRDNVLRGKDTQGIHTWNIATQENTKYLFIGN